MDLVNWFLKYKRENLIKLENSSKFSPLEKVLLANRDIFDEDTGEKFLNPSIDDLNDPFLFNDMSVAIQSIVDCISSGESIRIVGDYDQDGVAATSILVKGIRYVAERMGGDPFQAVSYAIPDRVEDGYGINEKIVDNAYDDGISLIITCDNGISAFDALNHASEIGLPVIVTDHHRVVVENYEEKLPEAIAVLNPHSVTSGYPFEELCGAGVAYKVIEGLLSECGEEIDIENGILSELIQFAALGTICDVVPLVGENRTIVSLGLNAINTKPNSGIKALLDSNSWESEVTTYTAGFVIGPCINASGRLFTARLGVELFLDCDENTVFNYAKELVELNRERKEMTLSGVDKAIQMIEQMHSVPNIIFLYIPDIHESICGLIAGRIKEKYTHPTLVFTDAEDGEGVLKGSGRSIPQYDMFESLNAYRSDYISFGGHSMACGMSIDKSKFKLINDNINKSSGLKNDDFISSIDFDAVLNFQRIDFTVLDSIKKFEPYGANNPKPVFGTKNCNVRSVRLVGQNRNVLQMVLEQSGRLFSGVVFNGIEMLDSLRNHPSYSKLEKLLNGEPTGVQVDILYRPDKNDFRGNISIQLQLIDIRFSK